MERSKLEGGRLVASEIDCTIITRLFGDFDNIRLFFTQGTRLMEISVSSDL